MRAPPLPGFLRRNLRLKALACGLASLLWVGVVFAANPPETRTVTVHVPQEQARMPARYLLVHPIPDAAIRLAGTREHLSAFDPASLQLTADLASINHPGDQAVALSVVNRDRDVELDSVPPTVEVDVDELASDVVPVSIVISSPPPVGYVSSAESVDPDRVTVAGPRHRLAGVQAKVTVDLSNQRANLQQDFSIFPFDASGGRLTDLNITPPTARVSITVAASATSRATAVLPHTVGTVAPGHQLTGLSVEPPAVLLAGPQDLLNSMDSISTAPIPLGGLSGDTTVSARLVPPAGIRATPDSVTVRIAVAPLSAAPPPAATLPSPTP